MSLRKSLHNIIRLRNKGIIRVFFYFFLAQWSDIKNGFEKEARPFEPKTCVFTNVPGRGKGVGSGP